MTAAVVQGKYRGRLLSSQTRKNPENSLKSSYSRGDSVNLHCIKDRVLLDPTCGSGSFLTGTCLSLRRPENRVIALEQESARVVMGEGANRPAGFRILFLERNFSCI